MPITSLAVGLSARGEDFACLPSNGSLIPLNLNADIRIMNLGTRDSLWQSDYLPVNSNGWCQSFQLWECTKDNSNHAW